MLIFVMCGIIFLFKQKTAYEMRISDWSSDVCSSDLGASVVQGLSRAVGRDYRGQMSIQITSAFDGGNIRVLSITDDTAELEIETDHQSDFYQWFYFRVAGGDAATMRIPNAGGRSEEHTSELQSLMRISYAVFCLNKNK